MKLSARPIKLESIIISAAENRKTITIHLAEASDYDIKAANQLKVGNYEKAAYYAILSQEHIRLATEAKIKDLELHALYN
jgi:uncharacterized protein YqfB (UPF0267 family)